MISAERIYHRGKDQIKLVFGLNNEIKAKVKTINGAAWSKTHGAWLVPESVENKTALKDLFPSLKWEEETQKTKEPEYEMVKIEIKDMDDRNMIKVEVIGKKIFLKMPKNQADILFVRSLKYSRWVPNNYLWEISNYPGNLDLIKDHFNERIDEMTIHEKTDFKTDNKTIELSPIDMLVIKTKTGRLKIIFKYDLEFMNFLKRYPYHNWDSENKWWTIPYAEKYMEEIKQFAKEKDYKLIEEVEPKGEQGAKRKSEFDIVNYRKCPEEMRLKLQEIRYSERTIKVYCSAFEEFINFHQRYEINKIDEQKVIEFLRYLVMERKVSTSYQNQAINAIKFYYEKVLGGQRKFYFIDRPKKEKTLPTVLNEEEVIRLFAAVINIKHKCILMLAYSAGLRLGEIVRLKLVDIDRERMQIRVVQSKGKKDRYAKLSVKFLKVYDEYLAEYQPKEYLFEGATGGEYSPSSIQNIIKAVSQKAGIVKRVTMHTLRHTFATHSLENGVDLRYIQSMMGHESSRTTEIYTHITTKGFDQIKSPLDNLDI
jgi:integrase/recombinase XerD